MPPSPLPRFVLVQAQIQCISALGLGLALLTVPELVHDNPIANRLTLFLHPSGGGAPISGPLGDQLSTLCGVFSAAIGVAYLTNFYRGYEEWLYLSIPGRLFVSGLCLAIWFLAPEKMSPVLFAIMVWDGVCAAIGGYLMGSWSGEKRARLDPLKDE